MFSDYQSKIIVSSKYDPYVNLYPTWIGYLKAMPNYECKPRILDDYFMIYIPKGKGIFKCRNKTYPLKKGDLYFLFPDVIHYYKTDKVDLIEQWWIGFNGANSSNLLSDINITPENPVLSLGEHKHEVFKLIQKIYYNMEEFSVASKTKSCGNLYEIFGILMDKYYIDEQHPDNINKNVSMSIEKALAYIETNYPNQFSIVQVANYVGLNRTYFSTRFKEEVGCTPHEYISKIRLKQARYYLKNTQYSVSEIAHSVGFQDALYFSKLFHKHTGYPPTLYRKASPEDHEENHKITKGSI